MNKNEYALECMSMSIWERDIDRYIDKYPILKNYETRIEYPYPNTEAKRVVITIDDLKKFCDDIGQEIVLSKDRDIYSVEIYDDYRE